MTYNTLPTKHLRIMSEKIKAAMAAAQARQEKAEKRESKEQERKRQREVLSGAPAAAPAKYTKRMMSTQARKQAEKDRARQEEPQNAQELVFKVDGTQMPLGKALYDVIQFLQKREDMSEASFDEVH